MNNPPLRSGYVAIVGLPNVGKSTLLNRILNYNLSIVSPKPQTTLHSILGIFNEHDSQMIFLDTPGWLQPKEAVQVHMKRIILRVLQEDADLILWVLEPRPLTPEEWEFGLMLKKSERPLFVAVNKMDLVKNSAIIKEIETQLARNLDYPFEFHGVSSLTGQGLGKLKENLKNQLPSSPAYFPPDQITDRWERFYVGEWIREALFKLYQQEIPHAAAVLVEEFQERPQQKDRIEAVIYLEKESQKGIMIGRGGKAIKKLGETSRKVIEKQLGRPVYLDLRVKVHKNWRNDPQFLKRLTWM